MSGATPTPPCELMECKKARNNNAAYKRMLSEKDTAWEEKIKKEKEALETELRCKRRQLDDARRGKFEVYGEDSEDKKGLKKQLDAATDHVIACKKHHTGITPGMVIELATTKTHLAERISEVERLKGQKATQIQKVKTCQAKIETLEKEKSDLVGEARAYVEELVERHRSEAKDAIERLRGEHGFQLGAIQGKLEEALSNLGSSENALATLRTEMSTINERFKSVGDELKQTKTTLATKQIELDTTKEHVESVENELKDTQTTLTTTQTELNTSKELFKSAEDELEQTKLALETLQTEMNDANKHSKSVEDELKQMKKDMAESATREKDLLGKLAEGSKSTDPIATPSTSKDATFAVKAQLTESIPAPVVGAVTVSVPTSSSVPSTKVEPMVDTGTEAKPIDDSLEHVLKLEERVKRMSCSLKYYQKENAIAYAKKKAYAHAIYTGQETPPLVYGKSEYIGSSLTLCGKTDWLRMQFLNHKTAWVEEQIALASPAETKGRRKRGGKKGKGVRGKQGANGEDEIEEGSKKKAEEERYGVFYEESQDEDPTFRGLKPRRNMFEGHKSTFSNTYDAQKLTEKRKRELATQVDAILMRPCTSLASMSSNSSISGPRRTRITAAPSHTASNMAITPVSTTISSLTPITTSTTVPTPSSISTLASVFWSVSSFVGFMTGW
ncbi:hypothetical protein VTL71DRAFT_3714 [Oculimacula yallundae]|uniref:Uncharacterized protein n=1 Tax=Oculimacula yallundae TaxID=86028 RepID=A0ABR4C4Y9_9HELO